MLLKLGILSLGLVFAFIGLQFGLASMPKAFPILKN